MLRTAMGASGTTSADLCSNIQGTAGQSKARDAPHAAMRRATAK